MMSPMPFCPSLEPCAKLTPVHVSISSDRIHSGGALSFSGARYRSSRLIKAFDNKRRSAEQVKPTMGEISRDMPTSDALAQFTPSPNTCPAPIIELARPTPIMAPMSVWELEAGSPKYQVPTFQMMAEISSANTMANPAADPTLITSSTGSSAITPNATPPDELSTPMRFQHPDHTTATVGFNVWV